MTTQYATPRFTGQILSIPRATLATACGAHNPLYCVGVHVFSEQEGIGVALADAFAGPW
jgi:hypothetical protein